MLLELMKKGTLTADQRQVVELRQQWIDGRPGFGSFRRTAITFQQAVEYHHRDE